MTSNVASSSSGLFAYVEGNSFFHRLNPASKWVWAICVWAISISYSDIYRLTPVLVLVLASAVYSGIFRNVKSQLLGILLTIAVLVLIQGAFLPGAHDVVFTLIPKVVPLIGGAGSFTTTGLLFGIAISERFLCILFSTLVSIMTTTEEDLIAFLSNVVHLPYTYVLITVMALRFIPTITEEFHSILDAQRSRAFEPERMNLIRRLTTAYVPVIIPLASGAILKAEEVAITMQCRAFGGVGKDARKRAQRGRHSKMKIIDYTFISISIVLTVFYLSMLFIHFSL